MTSSTTSGSSIQRLRWLIGAAVLVIAVFVVWQLTGGSGDEPGDAGPNPSSTASPGSTGEPVGPVESSAVLVRAEAGRLVTFHAAYELTGVAEDDAASGLGVSAVELWRSDGWTRQDTRTDVPSGTTRTQGVRNPDGLTTICAMSVERVWGCTEQQTDEGNDLFLTAAAQLATVDVEATDVTIAGHEGTCFTAVEDESVQLCYRSDGVPLRLASSSGEVLEVVSIDDDVDDSIFTTPEDGSTEPAEG